MLQTKYKDKIPSFLTYPIGAKAISEAMAGVPQYDSLDLWFVQGKHEVLVIERRRKVVVAHYQRDNLGLSAARDADERGLYGPRWRICLYAVPRPMSTNVREVLAGHGFSSLRSWLAEIRTELWLSSSHSCALWFDTVTGQLVVTESER